MHVCIYITYYYSSRACDCAHFCFYFSFAFFSFFFFSPVTFSSLGRNAKDRLIGSHLFPSFGDGNDPGDLWPTGIAKLCRYNWRSSIFTC